MQTTSAPRSIQAGTWILVATILGSSMVFIDGTVVNVALPVLQKDFGATSADVQWVVEAYALFLSTLLLVGGALGDRLGRRRVFITGIIIFTIASMGCGLAQNIGELIVARAIQGIGGALLTPGSLAIISALFPPAERGRAIGTWSGFTTITSAAGPLLGGYLIQAASWRWIFFLNLPLAVATVLITVRYVPETRDRDEAGRVDYPGAALATLGLGGVVFALITASVSGFGNATVLIPLVAGVVFLVLFLREEQHSANPMMPLGLFRSRIFSGTNLLTFFLYGALGGALYFLPFNLQQIQGYTPLEAGLSLLPFTLIVFSLSRWAGGLITRYGARLPLIIGPSLAGLGFLLFARTGVGGNYWTDYFPAVIVLALGMAVTIAPLTTTVMGAVSQEHAGIASGINNAVARTASLIAIASLGIVVVAVFSAVLDQQLAGLHLSAAVHLQIISQSSKLAAIQIPTSVNAATHQAIRQGIETSFVVAFRVAMLIGAALAFASAICAALSLDRGAPRPAVAAKTAAA
jgi:EmrB/QacA subfamily drug resistance transporter